MKSKKAARIRRAAKARRKIHQLRATRLVVHRTPRHIYAQLIDSEGEKVLVSASTLDKGLRSEIKYPGNIDAAKVVGAKVAKHAIDAGIKRVAFDRAGYKYHGRVKALADAAREAGLEF